MTYVLGVNIVDVVRVAHVVGHAAHRPALHDIKSHRGRIIAAVELPRPVLVLRRLKQSFRHVALPVQCFDGLHQRKDGPLFVPEGDDQVHVDHSRERGCVEVQSSSAGPIRANHRADAVLVEARHRAEQRAGQHRTAVAQVRADPAHLQTRLAYRGLEEFGAILVDRKRRRDDVIGERTIAARPIRQRCVHEREAFFGIQVTRKHEQAVIRHVELAMHLLQRFARGRRDHLSRSERVVAVAQVAE